MVGLLVLLAANGPSAADEPSVVLSLWSGYGSVTMKAVNAVLQENYDALVGGSGGSTVDPGSQFGRFTGGFMGGVEAGVPVMPEFTVAAKAGYWSAGSARLTFSESSTFSFGPSSLTTVLNEDSTFSASVIPILFGGRIMVLSEPEGRLSIGLFGGFGLASASIKEDDVSSTTGTGLFSFLSSRTETSGTVPYSGAAVAAEITVGADIQLWEGLSAGVDLGYRYLKVGSMKVSQTVTDGSSGATLAKQGDEFKDSAGNPVPFDFSGMTAVFRVSYAI